MAQDESHSEGWDAYWRRFRASRAGHAVPVAGRPPKPGERDPYAPQPAIWPTEAAAFARAGQVLADFGAWTCVYRVAGGWRLMYDPAARESVKWEDAGRRAPREPERAPQRGLPPGWFRAQQPAAATVPGRLSFEVTVPAAGLSFDAAAAAARREALRAPRRRRARKE